jgi:uncharacterized protein (DUF58 family)
VEFKDHRAYSRGDDVRRIDWNAYARLEELVLRLYIAEEDLTIHLLIDRSRSLSFGSPPKIDVAKRAAAAIGYVGLTGSERVSVVPFGDGVDSPLPPSRGRRAVGSLLRHLENLEADGATDLERTVQQFLARRPKPGLVALFSDLLDPAGFERPIDRLLSEHHEPVIFLILDEAEPPVDRGVDLVLVDSERGTSVEVTLDGAARKAYRARLDAFVEEVESYGKRRGVSTVRLGRDIDLEERLISYLGRRSS